MKNKMTQLALISTLTLVGASAIAEQDVLNSSTPPAVETPSGFEVFDTDRNGELTLSEVQAVGLTEQQFTMMDTDSNQKISLSEYEQNFSNEKTNPSDY